MYYMGIDLHKKYFVSTIMDKEGKVLISTHFLVKNTLFQKSIADFGLIIALILINISCLAHKSHFYNKVQRLLASDVLIILIGWPW